MELRHQTPAPHKLVAIIVESVLTIEAATRELAAELRSGASQDGWRMSLRMGPGDEYRLPNGDGRVRWELTEQAALFQLFEGTALPVELLSSCAMKPKMSRSGVLGLGRVS